jgi:hypothetical protein
MTEETKSKLRIFWEGVRVWCFKYIGGLFMEEKDGKQVISIGRCLLIAVVGWMFSFWGVWIGALTITPEVLAQALVTQLPEGTEISGVDILAAADKVVDALPSAAPPLMQTAFLTACGYVFGSKASSILDKRLNNR